MPRAQHCTPAQLLARERTQYALLEKDGEPAQRYHQDDSCDPIVAGSIEMLISIAAEWADVGDDDFVQFLDTERFGGPFTIIKERVIVSTLTAQELRLLDSLSDKVYEYADHDECIESGQHLTDCDEDGYCNRCGHQD